MMENLAELLDRYLDGDLSDPERESLMAWLRDHPQDLDLLAERSRLHSALRRSLRRRSLQRGAAEEAQVSAPSTRRRAGHSWRWRRFPTARGWGRTLAAAAALLIGIPVVIVLVSSPQTPAPPRASSLAPERKPSDTQDDERIQTRVERERIESEWRVAQEERRKLAEAKKATEDADRQAELKAKESELARLDAEFKARVEAARERERQAQRDSRASAPGIKPVESPPQTTATRATVARVGRAEEAFVVADGTKKPLKGGEDILAGQGLEVGPGGMALLTYPDTTWLSVGAETVLQDFSSDGGKRLFVERGTVRAEVARQPKDQPMLFRTPHGEAKVVGTTLRLTVGQKGTRLDVEEGKVQLKSLTGRAVDVVSGHYAVTAVGVEPAVKPHGPPAYAVLEETGEVTISFGPAGRKLPENILIDSGEPFDVKRGYGWQGPNEQVVKLPGFLAYRRRVAFQPPGRDPQDLRASRISGGGGEATEQWLMRVPKGKYLVSVSAGRYGSVPVGYRGGPFHVQVAGVQLIDGVEVTQTDEFVERKDVPVFAPAGELRMVIGGHRRKIPNRMDGELDTPINYIRVKKAP